MSQVKIIEFQKKRDFSDKVNATLSFGTQNYKGLLKSLLYIGGPPTLVASMLMSSFISDFFALSFRSGGGDPDAMLNYFSTVNFWLQIGMTFVFFITAAVVITATTYNYIILYREKRSPDIEVHEVWERVRQTFWMYLGTAVLFGIVAMLTMVILTLPAFILGSISPFLVMFGVMFLMIAVVYLYVGASLVFVIRAFEKKGFIDALMRSFQLVRTKWWSTLAVSFILSMLVGIFSMIFYVPAYAIMMIKTLHSVRENSFQPDDGGVLGVVVLILMTCYYLSQLILSSLPNIGLAFQYFNLVEMKEAKGLMGEIETLGKPQEAPQHPEDY